jgi:hypothetical protein
VPIARRVSFTILDMDPAIYYTEPMILSDENLVEDWNRPEEDWRGTIYKRLRSLGVSPFSDLSGRS